MRVKLDEKLGKRCETLIRDFGHDVETVVEEGLQGSNDAVLFEFCTRERRCLLTLDLVPNNPT